MGIDPADKPNISLNGHYDMQTYLSQKDAVENFNLLNYNAVFTSDWGSYADKAGMSQLWKTEKDQPPILDADLKDIVFLTVLPKGIKAAFNAINSSTQNTVQSENIISAAPYKDYDEDQDNIEGENRDKDTIAGIELDATTIVILCIALFGVAIVGRKIPF